jgi:hypothetical protein
MEDETVSIYILSLLGNTVYSRIDFFGDKPLRVDLSNQEKGVYLIKTISSAGRGIVKRIVIE